jgi:hypothetical protein
LIVGMESPLQMRIGSAAPLAADQKRPRCAHAGPAPGPARAMVVTPHLDVEDRAVTKVTRPVQDLSHLGEKTGEPLVTRPFLADQTTNMSRSSCVKRLLMFIRSNR